MALGPSISSHAIALVNIAKSTLFKTIIKRTGCCNYFLQFKFSYPLSYGSLQYARKKQLLHFRKQNCINCSITWYAKKRIKEISLCLHYPLSLTKAWRVPDLLCQVCWIRVTIVDSALQYGEVSHVCVSKTYKQGWVGRRRARSRLFCYHSHTRQHGPATYLERRSWFVYRFICKEEQKCYGWRDY